MWLCLQAAQTNCIVSYSKLHLIYTLKGAFSTTEGKCLLHILLVCAYEGSIPVLGALKELAYCQVDVVC